MWRKNVLLHLIPCHLHTWIITSHPQWTTYDLTQQNHFVWCVSQICHIRWIDSLKTSLKTWMFETFQRFPRKNFNSETLLAYQVPLGQILWLDYKVKSLDLGSPFPRSYHIPWTLLDEYPTVIIYCITPFYLVILDVNYSHKHHSR